MPALPADNPSPRHNSIDMREAVRDIKRDSTHYPVRSSPDKDNRIGKGTLGFSLRLHTPAIMAKACEEGMAYGTLTQDYIVGHPSNSYNESTHQPATCVRTDYSLTGDSGAHRTRIHSAAARCRLTTARGPCHPGDTNPARSVKLKSISKVPGSRPITVIPSPVPHGWSSGPRAFPVSSEPAGQARAHARTAGTGRTHL